MDKENMVDSFFCFSSHQLRIFGIDKRQKTRLPAQLKQQQASGLFLLLVKYIHSALWLHEKSKRWASSRIKSSKVSQLIRTVNSQRFKLIICQREWTRMFEMEKAILLGTIKWLFTRLNYKDDYIISKWMEETI